MYGDGVSNGLGIMLDFRCFFDVCVDVRSRCNILPVRSVSRSVVLQMYLRGDHNAPSLLTHFSLITTGKLKIPTRRHFPPQINPPSLNSHHSSQRTP